MAKRPPTPKQQRFVEEYLIDLNATQAAIRAGYSKNGAEVQGHHLLRNPNLKPALAAGRAKLSERTEITQDWVLARLRENLERAMTIEAPRDDKGNVIGEFGYQGSVANKALELLGRHLGMFPTRAEHTGANGGPIEYHDLSSLTLEQLDERFAQLVGKWLPSEDDSNADAPDHRILN